jgi:Gamma-glutamyl cyclotransferase, AIG2-like
MARKFQLANEHGWKPESITIVPKVFSPEYYFFYGSLMDSATLMKVLKLLHQPELVPARITGYSCKLWGQYPALVDGPAGNDVHGMA